MSEINRLNAVDTTSLSSGDLLPMYSQAAGDSRKISFTNFFNWLEDQQIATQDNKVTQYSAPLTGATITVTDSQNSIWLILTPAGTIATATIKFPLYTNVLDKTEILMNTTNTITALTLDSNGGTIVGGITTLAANSFARYRFDIVMRTWYRIA